MASLASPFSCGACVVVALSLPNLHQSFLWLLLCRFLGQRRVILVSPEQLWVTLGDLSGAARSPAAMSPVSPVRGGAYVVGPSSLRLLRGRPFFLPGGSSVAAPWGVPGLALLSRFGVACDGHMVQWWHTRVAREGVHGLSPLCSHGRWAWLLSKDVGRMNLYATNHQFQPEPRRPNTFAGIIGNTAPVV